MMYLMNISWLVLTCPRFRSRPELAQLRHPKPAAIIRLWYSTLQVAYIALPALNFEYHRLFAQSEWLVFGGCDCELARVLQ